MNGRPLSIFSSASDAAARISTLAWFMIVASSLVFVIVVAIMLAAIVRNRASEGRSVDLSERSSRFVVWGGAVIPGVILIITFTIALGAMRGFSPVAPVVSIRVTGQQWWWNVEYLDSAGHTRFRTANEIHIPVGQPVRLLVTSADVIHSFWVPQLQGKLDAIPGSTHELFLRARRTGTYSGACAEYCGQQHAHMAFAVVSETDDAYRAWVSRQWEDGLAPTDSVAVAGRTLFTTTECASCHTIRGTPARAELAPDLTHIGSRLSIAAGTRPNSLGNIAGWIANPQALKPGTHMPTLRVYTGPELRAIATYLTSLK